MNKVLIVVDMQNDFIYGALGTPEARDIVDNVRNKVLEAQRNGDLVYFTKDIHCEDYNETIEGKCVPPHCREYSEGSEIIPELLELMATTTYPNVIAKSTYGSFFWDYMQDVWDDLEVSEIELCGVCTDICVISNALILRSMYPMTQIRVDSSCCAGLTPEKHRAALEVMKSCNIEVINE